METENMTIGDLVNMIEQNGKKLEPVSDVMKLAHLAKDSLLSILCPITDNTYQIIIPLMGPIISRERIIGTIVDDYTIGGGTIGTVDFLDRKTYVNLYDYLRAFQDTHFSGHQKVIPIFQK